MVRWRWRSANFTLNSWGSILRPKVAHFVGNTQDSKWTVVADTLKEASGIRCVLHFCCPLNSLFIGLFGSSVGLNYYLFP